MDTTKLSSKGQVILPKHSRTAHKWQPGVEFSVEDTQEGVLLRPLKLFKPSEKLVFNVQRSSWVVDRRPGERRGDAPSIPTA